MPGVQKAADSALLENTLTAIAGFITEPYDYIDIQYPSATQETYEFRTGGVGGTTVGTITLNYTDSTKANLSNASVA